MLLAVVDSSSMEVDTGSLSAAAAAIPEIPLGDDPYLHLEAPLSTTARVVGGAPQDTRHLDVSRLVNLKDLAKPPSFSGKESEWKEWRFRFESVAALLGLEVLMHGALEISLEEVDALDLREQSRSKVLYSVLVCMLWIRP